MECGKSHDPGIQEERAAIADHGRVVCNAIEEDLQEAHRILRDIERLGIPFAYVTWQLQNEGIQKFIESYGALMQALAVKHQEFLSAHTRAVSF